MRSDKSLIEAEIKGANRLADLCSQASALISLGHSLRKAYKALNITAPSLSKFYVHYRQWEKLQEPGAFSNFVLRAGDWAPFIAYTLKPAGKCRFLIDLYRHTEADWQAGKRIPIIGARQGKASFPITKRRFYRIIPAKIRALLKTTFRKRRLAGASIKARSSRKASKKAETHAFDL